MCFLVEWEGDRHSFRIQQAVRCKGFGDQHVEIICRRDVPKIRGVYTWTNCGPKPQDHLRFLEEILIVTWVVVFRSIVRALPLYISLLAHSRAWMKNSGRKLYFVNRGYSNNSSIGSVFVSDQSTGRHFLFCQSQ